MVMKAMGSIIMNTTTNILGYIELLLEPFTTIESSNYKLFTI